MVRWYSRVVKMNEAKVVKKGERSRRKWINCVID